MRFLQAFCGNRVTNVDKLCCPSPSVTLQVIAHSVGTWVAYEFMQAARATGLPLPRHAFLSAMAAPDLPLAQRPWRRQAKLDEAEFQVTPFLADKYVIWELG